MHNCIQIIYIYIYKGKYWSHKITAQLLIQRSAWQGLLGLLVEPASSWEENVSGVAFLHLISAMNKALHILQPSTGFLGRAMCLNCLLNSPLMIVAVLRLQFRMKLKPGFKILFMAVFPIFLLSNNRLFKVSTLLNSGIDTVNIQNFTNSLNLGCHFY